MDVAVRVSVFMLLHYSAFDLLKEGELANFPSKPMKRSNVTCRGYYFAVTRSGNLLYNQVALDLKTVPEYLARRRSRRHRHRRHRRRPLVKFNTPVISKGAEGSQDVLKRKGLHEGFMGTKEGKGEWRGESRESEKGEGGWERERKEKEGKRVY